MGLLANLKKSPRLLVLPKKPLGLPKKSPRLLKKSPKKINLMKWKLRKSELLGRCSD